MAKPGTVKSRGKLINGKRGNANEKFTVGEVAAMLMKTQGNIAIAAEKFGVQRKTLYEYIKRYDLQSILDDARASIVDAAESALYSAVLGKEGWAVCFTLKTIGKDRGYTERQEIAATNVNIDWDDLTEHELERIAAGEQPAAVIASRLAKAGAEKT